jgi:hypothetical protein
VNEREEMLAFMKELSNALISVRPLGGSELFVKRFGDYFADPAYCKAAIQENHERYHETMKENVRLRREIAPAITPLAWDAPHNRSYPPVEARAEVLYVTVNVDHEGKRWPWVTGGNSTRQDEMRALARQELREAGHTPAVCSHEEKSHG